MFLVGFLVIILLLCYTKIFLIEPSTATVLGKVANCELEDFKKAIGSAAKAQEEYYFSTTAAQRGAALRKWYELIMANQDDSMSRDNIFRTAEPNQMMQLVRYCALRMARRWRKRRAK